MNPLGIVSTGSALKRTAEGFGFPGVSVVEYARSRCSLQYPLFEMVKIQQTRFLRRKPVPVRIGLIVLSWLSGLDIGIITIGSDPAEWKAMVRHISRTIGQTMTNPIGAAATFH